MGEKTTVVIPTVRDLEFLDDWKETDLIDCHLIVVEDQPQPTCKIPDGWNDVTRYTWKDIDEDLKDNSWIIPRGDGGIKSFGLAKAHAEGSKYVICLDDDVYPLNPRDKFVESHINFLNSEVKNSRWFTQIKTPNIFPRGYPIDPEHRKLSKIVLNMGLWKENPDLSAFEYFKTEYDPTKEIEFHAGVIPYGQFFCLSAMNMSFKSEIIPAFYQMPMGHKFGIYRYDDVWSGMFVKKIADYLGNSVSMGEPMVVHKRKSDPRKSLQREIHGMALHEQLRRYVEDFKFNDNCDDWKSCYENLGNGINMNFYDTNRYLSKVGWAMMKWVELF